MLYKYGTLSEVYKTASRFPEEVFTTLSNGTALLDSEYGENRDYTEIGGYSIIAENHEDLIALRDVVNVDTHPCEIAKRLGRSGYICAVFVFNNDFSIMLFLPERIAPKSIMESL